MKTISQDKLRNEIAVKSDSLDCLEEYRGKINDRALTIVIESIEEDVFKLTEELILMREQEQADSINTIC